MFHKLRMFWQRGTRGWCDEDKWDILAYQCRVLPEMLDELAEDGHSFPPKYESATAWSEELRNGARLFRKLGREYDALPNLWIPYSSTDEAMCEYRKRYSEHDEVQKKAKDEALDWLKQHWFYLWD